MFLSFLIYLTSLLVLSDSRMIEMFDRSTNEFKVKWKMALTPIRHTPKTICQIGSKILIQVIQLITIIKQSENENIERSQLSKFSEMPKNAVKFFSPARTITPRQFQRKVKRVPRARDLTSPCYTHTTSYLGKCYIICDNQVVTRCGN